MDGSILLLLVLIINITAYVAALQMSVQEYLGIRKHT